MEKQNLQSELSVASTDKANLDKELISLVSMPTRLAEISSQGVRQIACGSAHILALVDAGDVYAWGSGRSGQLGLGKQRSEPAPVLVWGLMRKGVRQIGAGAYHSAALTYNGYLYTWGSSSSGQLGHGNKRTQLQPKLVEALEAEARERSSTVRLVGCGARHTVAVLGNGELYTWGKPDFGMLGRSKTETATEPQLIEAMWRREVCGTWRGGGAQRKGGGAVAHRVCDARGRYVFLVALAGGRGQRGQDEGAWEGGDRRATRAAALGAGRPRCTRDIRARCTREMHSRDAPEMRRAQEVLRYYPDIEADPEAALFLTKAVADDLEKRVKQLQSELEQARSHVHPPPWHAPQSSPGCSDACIREPSTAGAQGQRGGAREVHCRPGARIRGARARGHRQAEGDGAGPRREGDTLIVTLTLSLSPHPGRAWHTLPARVRWGCTRRRCTTRRRSLTISGARSSRYSARSTRRRRGARTRSRRRRRATRRSSRARCIAHSSRCSRRSLC